MYMFLGWDPGLGEHSVSTATEALCPLEESCLFELIVKIHHWASCTVIHSCVFSGQPQGKLILHCVYCHSYSVLERQVVPCVSITINSNHSHQPFPWMLTNPVTFNGVTSENTDEEQWQRSLQQTGPWLLQLHHGQDTFEQRTTVTLVLRTSRPLFSTGCL